MEVSNRSIKQSIVRMRVVALRSVVAADGRNRLQR